MQEYNSYRGRSFRGSNIALRNIQKLQSKIYNPAIQNQLASVTDVNEQTGIITLSWISYSDSQQNLFTVNAPTIETGENHFWGGLPAVNDICLIGCVSTNERASYRFIIAVIAHNYTSNFLTGIFPQLHAGEKLISVNGSQAYFDNAGSIKFETGFRTPREQKYNQAIQDNLVTNDPGIIHQRDFITLFNSQVANDLQPLRTYYSIFNSSLVQYGKINRIDDVGQIRTIDMVSDHETEFRVVLLDEDRRDEKMNLFIGFGYSQDGSAITTNMTNRHAIGGFRFFDEKFDSHPGILFDNLGGFEITDSFENSFFTDSGSFNLISKDYLNIQAGAGANLDVIGEYTESAGNKINTYKNLSLYVDSDYTEQISAQHTAIRNNFYLDSMTINPTDPLANYYKWKILTSPIAQIEMDSTQISFGTETSITNIVLNETQGKLGTDTIIAPITYSAPQTQIGNGSPVKVVFSAANNSIHNDLGNEITGASNFFGINFGNVSQPITLGTNLSTYLATINSSLETMGTALSVFFTAIGIAVPPLAPAVGTVAAAMDTFISEIATATGNITSITSKTNFTA